MILGLITAAGDSRRMGREKARLLIQGEEAWLHLARKMLAAGCERILLGIPPRLRDPLQALVPPGLSLAVIPPDLSLRGALGTLCHLLSLVREPFDSCLIAPVDHPYVQVETLSTLLQQPGPIRIPTERGRRGHPIALDQDHAALIPGLKNSLRELTQDPSQGAIEVPVSDPSIHWNLDRPEDYERFQHIRKRT